MGRKDMLSANETALTRTDADSRIGSARSLKRHW